MIARLGVVGAKLSSRLGPVRLIRPPGEMGLGNNDAPVSVRFGDRRMMP